MNSVRGISFCIYCFGGLMLLLKMCAAGSSNVWLTGDEQYNISSVDIDGKVEEDFVLIFNTTSRHRIRFSTSDFDFEAGFVFMSIGEGTEKDGAGVLFEDPLTYTGLASFSGSDSPSVVTSVSNSAWISVTFSRIQRKLNFNVTVSCTNMSDITEVNEGGTISIRSMNNPSNYPNNYYRLWDIRTHEGYVIEVIVRSFDVETGHDHVYICDGVDSFSNQGSKWRDWTGLWENEVLESRDFISSTNSITMIFTTDFSTTKSGFWIQLRAAKKPAAATTASAASVATTTTTSNASTTHEDPVPSTSSYIITTGPLLDTLIFKWVAIISSSILLLVILTCTVLKYKRRKQTARNDTDISAKGPESERLHIMQDEEPTGERVQESSTEPDSLPGRPYETIPEYLLAPSHSPVGDSNCPASGPDNERVDEFGYMVPDRDKGGELPDEQSPVSRDGYTDINHTYLDTSLSSSQQGSPHTYHAYENSMMTMKSFGGKDEQLSSHYYNIDSTGTSNRY
ncbi:uncharacterized protein LOC135155651 [Lytechinus pictus]|uniref:uncharacterized protein LOC135155651 n=1 Tax=Lytechinus pictus TaxID=7653 RepID=UPI0030B9F462